MKLQEWDIIASISRESFYEFVVEFWDSIIQEPPVFNWHIRYICDELQEVAERVFRGEDKLYDLVINVPPGSTKSTIVSQMFPAWVWTRMPSAKFIGASYAKEIALKDAVKCRDIVQSDKYQKCFPDIQLREDENRKGLFVNTQTGFRFSAGTSGALTGFHGHFLTVDDPLNPEESFSKPDLDKVNRWMTQTLPMRKIDKRVTVTILVQQRLHQSDPSGEMLKAAEADPTSPVRHICLPGEETDAISPPELRENYRDGLLDPVRMPRNILQSEQKKLGAYGYSAQILQDPVPLGGGMFKTNKVVLVEFEPKPGSFVDTVRSWDKAGTDAGGNYSVGVKMSRHRNGSYWITDVEREQLAPREREELMKSTADNDGEAVTILLEIEGGSGGIESAQNSTANLAGYRVISEHPTGPKEARAYGFASQMGAGNVYVLNRPWTKEFLEELRFFPKSRYSDQVDAASQAFNRLARPRKKIGGL